MDFDRTQPSDEQIRKWFITEPTIENDTFEIALVLGGTVSAGAYTAGVLDFLIEALDQWTEIRDQGNDPDAPKHKVILKVITGTSGGGVNAAIVARALNFDFAPARHGSGDALKPPGNPLYDVWVRTLTLDRFLDTGDLKHGVTSILNGTAVDAGARQIVEFGDVEKNRAWVATPLRVIMTLTNLRGIRYRLDFGEGRNETYVNHADYARFAIVYPGQEISEFRPDEQVVFFGPSCPIPLQLMAAPDRFVDWDTFSQFARATAAFPAGFPPRKLTRPTSDYKYRIIARSDRRGAPYDMLIPDWDSLETSAGVIPAEYSFVAVDGGATDNEPIELARTALCGVGNMNPRSASEAKRAVVLVDPFAGVTNSASDGPEGFFPTLVGVGNSLIEQARYDSRDLVLAADKDVFSRFMITPQRETLTGADAIASAGLSAFVGFACPEFMHHDFMLGRRNCQAFLRRYFVLSNDNKVFGGSWTAAQKRRFAAEAAAGTQPIIPLMGTAWTEQRKPQWPKGKLNPATYRAAIENRIKAISQTELSHWHLQWSVPIGLTLAKPKPADLIIELIEEYLQRADLKV